VNVFKQEKQSKSDSIKKYFSRNESKVKPFLGLDRRDKILPFKSLITPYFEGYFSISIPD